ncbi:MAG: hypothetical protein LLG97_12365 [Deltaproteobacteria bacterium]|nr:hypothetical protein [Deltaproteobacteria bacterium]
MTRPDEGVQLRAEFEALYKQNAIEKIASEVGGELLMKALSEIAFLKTCGVIELMVRNPNIDSFVKDKESELAALKARVRNVLHPLVGDCEGYDCGPICHLYRDCAEKEGAPCQTHPSPRTSERTGGCAPGLPDPAGT